jgi:hypothetical protein
MENISVSKKRRIIGNILIILGGLMLPGSASAKLAHVPAVVSQLGPGGLTAAD